MMEMMNKAKNRFFWPKENYHRIRNMLGELNLATVCQEALCPNIAECWEGGTATFMLMGDTCTRACRFCAVKTGNPQGQLDEKEGEKVAHAVEKMKLSYVVLTSVDRDDLPDGGSSHFAKCIATIKKNNSSIMVEALAPDFNGEKECIDKLISAKVDVFAHNVETVERLTPVVRDRRNSYRQSLQTLSYAKERGGPYSKSSLMLGLGEEDSEVRTTLGHLRDIGVDGITFGQYLAPTARHKKYLPVKKYISAEKFKEFKQMAEEMGFLFVASGPLVRSSYRAGEYIFSRPKMKINREHWGRIDYALAHQRQEDYIKKIKGGKGAEVVVFCSHNPVVTLGRQGLVERDLCGWKGEVYKVHRGGKATYHGPGQVICYPLLNLKLRKNNVAGLLDALEMATVKTLKHYGLSAVGSGKRGVAKETGVWIGGKKIASLGLALKNWISYHGLAFNLLRDNNAFQGIHPCGLSAEEMTSLEEVLKKRPTHKSFEEIFWHNLLPLIPC